MRRAGSIALAVAVGMLGCTGPGLERTTLACEFRVAPRGDGMPDLEMLVGDTVETDLKDHFGPVECLESYEEHGLDIFLAESSDAAAVAVSISGIDLGTVAIGAADSVRVTVGYTGYIPHDDSLEFLVRVRPPPAGR